MDPLLSRGSPSLVAEKSSGRPDWGTFQYHQGRLDEAELTLDEAIALNDDVPHIGLTAQAKQAPVYLAQGKREAALALAGKVWQQVEPTAGKSCGPTNFQLKLRLAICYR